MRTLPIAVFFCLSLFLITPSHAIKMAGVNIADTVKTSTPGAPSEMLKLNGAGIRYKIFFKVYVAALYLTEPSSTAEGVFANTGAKQINLTMLRDIRSDSLSNAFNEGVQRNTSATELEKLSPQFKQLNELFAVIPELKKGDVISIVWTPDVGTAILFNRKKIGEKIVSAPFFNALLRIWLGENPVSGDLKKELLGEVAEH